MNFEDVWAKSAIIQKSLVKTLFFKKARKIAIYSSIQNEVLTDDIFERARLEKKAIYYPRVFKDAQKMRFFSVRSLDELSPGAYDIREPSVSEDRAANGQANSEEGARKKDGNGAIDAAELELIIIPGVAFDINGARLGFGKGFYDRALTNSKCRLVALAYDFQLRDLIPSEPFDIRMKTIITEKRLINI